MLPHRPWAFLVVLIAMLLISTPLDRSIKVRARSVDDVCVVTTQKTHARSPSLQRPFTNPHGEWLAQNGVPYIGDY